MCDLNRQIKTKERILRELGVRLSREDLAQLRGVKDEWELESLHSRLIRR